MTTDELPPGYLIIGAALSRRAVGSVVRFGRLDTIANLAGSPLLASADLTTEGKWHATLAANLTSALVAAATYVPRGIRVIVVAPGLVRTPLTASQASERASVAMHALGRLGEPEDVASLIAWLLDPRQRWVTGRTFGADAGIATLRGRG